MNIKLVSTGAQVSTLARSLELNSWLWNKNRFRTAHPESPHREVDDIWVRYSGNIAEGPHESVWYEASNILPVRDLVFDVMTAVSGERLGGVLITRISAGKQCYPHVDTGWHAGYYDKFAVQIAGNDQQAFHFNDEKLVTKTGDVFWFDNSKTHWVTNDSAEDRITLIICIRMDKGN